MATVITTINASDLITNSRTDLNSNFSSLNTNKLETSSLSTDNTFAGASDTKIASQLAVKTYVDTVGQQTYIVPTGGILPYAGSSAPSNYLMCDGAGVSRSTYSTLFALVGTTYGVGNGTTTFNVPDLRNRVPLGAGTGTKVATFASRASNVITVTGLTNAANNEFQTGQAVVYSTTGAVITGLTNATTYYVVRTGNLTFSLASSLSNAQNGTVVSLSSDGTGTQTFTITYTTRTRADTGGEENHAMSSTELLSHTHTITTPYLPRAYTSAQGGGSNSKLSSPTEGAGTDLVINNAGGNAAMNIMQPFLSLNYIIKT